MQAVERTIISTTLIIATLTLAPCAEAQTRRSPARVLLIFQQLAETEPMLEFTRGLRPALDEAMGSPVELYQESLDLDRVPGRESSPTLLHYFDDKYRALGIDVVVPVGSRALQFATERLANVLPGVPVVFALGAAPRMDPSALAAHVTGRYARSGRFTPTLWMARGLQPDAERIVIISGAGPADSNSVSTVVRAISDLGAAPPLTIMQGMSLDAMLAALRLIPRRSIVVFANFRQDPYGRVFEPLDIVGSLARASAAPMYTQLRSYIGEGIVGGSVTRFDEEGKRTARLIGRVLRRPSRAPLPPAEVIENSFVADWRQLRRWGLSEDRLPLDTEVLFRDATPWQRYRTLVLVAIGVIGAESYLISRLLLERRTRKHAQLALEQQAAYEQTMAKLTALAAHHVLDDAPRTLEDILACIATYAGASAATLTQYAETPSAPPLRLFWISGYESAVTNRPLSATVSPDVQTELRLEIPLVADGAMLGTLAFYRANNRRAWPMDLARRLHSTGEVLASAMARFRAGRAIRRAEELNRAVLTSLSTPIAILDHRGTIIRVNEAWRDIARRELGDANPDAFVGWNYLEECRRAENRFCDAAGDVRRGIEALLGGNESPFRFEYHCTPPTDRSYELYVDRLQLPEGGAIVAHLDITDRRLAEEARRQVAHVGRVALVGELTATVSHELRQPLAAIRLNAEAGALLLAKSPDHGAEARELFESIVADDARAVKVIESVRGLLQKVEPTATAVDLNAICREAVRHLQHDAAVRNTRLELSLAPSVLRVMGDAVQLQQVVHNLVLNALEAAAPSSANHHVVVQTEWCGDRVELVVQDSGPGIPPAVRAHLFESFFSTKPGGLGLGLVIARSIVERHCGRIHGESHPAGGAVFRVSLPMAAPEARAEGGVAGAFHSELFAARRA